MDYVWVYMQKMELRYWWEYGDEKTRMISLIPWGFRVPIWKKKFCSSVCGFPNCLDVRKDRKLPYVVLND